jgi:flagellar basal-body rod protein FlgG
LQGKGFFSVETPNGERYTRSGEFTLDSEGFITTKEGYKVQGQNGPIQVDGENIIINEDGQVFSDGIEIDALKLVDFNDYALLKKEGDALYIDLSGDAGNIKESEGLVLQGSFEASNVNSVKMMVEMITMLRSYEANQKVIKTHDELLGKSVNEIGRV